MTWQHGAGTKGSALIVIGRIDETAGAADQDTLVQARSVADVLQQLGMAVETLEIGLDLERHVRDITRIGPDVIFNLVEKIDGRDSLLPVAGYLLERVGIPYSGAPAAALASTTDKLLAKRLMAAAEIPTPEWRNGSPTPFRGFDDPGEADARWIVKSATEHASFGLSEAAVVATPDIASRIRLSTGRHGGTWFAERYVHGREMNVSLLADGDRVVVLPIAEIEFLNVPDGKPRIVGHAAKWEPESASYRNTRRRFLDPDEAELSKDLSGIARRCWDLFGLGGYARVDFRLDEHGRPWVLEINANPCLSPDAGFFAAVERAGMSYVDMIGRIVQDAGITLAETIEPEFA